MKILHTSDLHFNTQWFEWIANQQDEYDVFVISGDFLDSSKDESLVEQIAWVSTWIRAFNKPLFICSGNHDIEEFDDEEWLNRIDTENYYPDNSKKSIEGIRFGCYPFIGAEGYYDFDDVDVLFGAFYSKKTQFDYKENQELVAFGLNSLNSLQNPDENIAFFSKVKYYINDNSLN